MKTGKVLDSYALLSYLQGERGCAVVKAALASDEIRILMNEINLGEVFYILARGRGLAQGDHFLDSILPLLPIKIIGNDLDRVIQAARIKAEYSLSYADCFAVVTARDENAAILTGDPEFKAVESLVRIEWIT